MTIGELIREERKKRGLSQKELAARMNVVQSYISQYENDRLSPGLDTLEKFASAIGCSIADLLPIETITADNLRNLPEISTQQIIDRLKDLLKDFDSIIDHGSRESVYNALLDTVRFLEKEGASLPDPERARLLRLFRKLNREGRARLVDFAEDLSSIRKYTE